MADRAVSVLDAARRPLTTTERRLIRSKIRSLTARSRRASRVALPISGGVVLLLWLWTVLATDASWLIVTLFWFVVGGAIALWVRRDMGVHAGHFGTMAHDLESALRRNAADVYDIHARSCAVLEETEDEGACYAFELDGDRLVFVTGQEFYSSRSEAPRLHQQGRFLRRRKMRWNCPSTSRFGPVGSITWKPV